MTKLEHLTASRISSYIQSLPVIRAKSKRAVQALTE